MYAIYWFCFLQNADSMPASYLDLSMTLLHCHLYLLKLRFGHWIPFTSFHQQMLISGCDRHSVHSIHQWYKWRVRRGVENGIQMEGWKIKYQRTGEKNKFWPKKVPINICNSQNYQIWLKEHSWVQLLDKTVADFMPILLSFECILFFWYNLLATDR